MPDELKPDELDDYLRGGSDVSCQYRQESATEPPHELDRLVLESAGSLNSKVAFKPQSLAPFAFAASMLLSSMEREIMPIRNGRRHIRRGSSD